MLVKRDSLSCSSSSVESSRSGTWIGHAGCSAQHWILVVQPDMCPSTFGAVVSDSASTDSNELVLLRGVADHDKLRLLEVKLDCGLPEHANCNDDCAELSLENHGRTLVAAACNLELHICERYAP